MKRLSATIINDIIARYKAGEQSCDIAVYYGIRDNSIARICRRNGFEPTKIKHLQQEDIDKAVKMYVEDKLSSEIIAKQFDVDPGVITRAVRKSGASIRPATENKRKYKLNDTFFEKIDKEENAYFLGLLYSDGSLASKHGNNIKLELQPQDIDILKQFSMILYGFDKIEDDLHKDTNTTYKMVNVYSKKMHQDLIKLGCTPKKSFTIIFPITNIVPEYLMHHFIRGFMDGDGCICITDENRPRIDFTSTDMFLTGLYAWLIKEVPSAKISGTLQQRHPDRNTNTRNIQVSGFNNVIPILQYIYKDATIFLARKKSKYDTILKQQQINYSRKQEKKNNSAKYGTAFIPSVNNQQITKEYLTTLSNEQKDLLIDPLFQFYRENKFPYCIFDDDTLVKDFLSLKNANEQNIVQDNILSMSNNNGSNIFKHFSHHFYEVNEGNKKRKNMLDTFNDDDLLKKVIKNRLYQNFSLTGNELKAGLANSKIAFKASIFNCAIAKYIYSQYTKENSIIYDYSMGFGQRLLGAISLQHNIKYIGIDPLEKTINSNKAIFDFFNTNIPMFGQKAEFYCVGSENFCNKEYIGKIDLAFSSPPYYNLEIYSDDDSQAYSISYVHFLNKYWRDTVKNINQLLTNNGKFIINICNEVNGFDIGNDMCNIMREEGFILEKTFRMQLSRNLEFGGRHTHKYEPIYVFSR